MLKWCSGASLALLFVIASPSLARADVAACVQLHASGQREANAGHLKVASEQFAACGGNEECPAAIRDECVELYARTEKNLPTVILSAADRSGKDISSARVYASDQLLAEALDGRALGIDPGNYEFKFVMASGETVTATALIREAEKNRLVAVRLPPLATAAPPAAATTSSSGRRLSPAFFVTAGLGAAGLTSFGVFALLGNGQKSKLDDCKPSCSSDQHAGFDAMRRDYLIADISLGVGLASAGVATWLFLSSRRAAPTTDAAKVTVVPLLSRSALGVVVNAKTF